MISIDVDAAVVVPVNSCPLIDDTDFKTRETAVAYNAAGLDLVWNFITSAGVVTQTAVTPTTAGVYDWTNVGDAMYAIEIPASGGASINNDTEGYGYFTGVATGVLPWRGPTIRFRAAGLNDLMTDSAYSATRGLAGTALPAAAADAAGGLPISDAGGLDLDALNTAAVRLTAARAQAIDDWINGGRLDLILDIIAADVVNLDGAAMRGTDSAATAADMATLLTRLSALRAGYLDNLSAGATATAAALAALNNLSSGDAQTAAAAALTAYDPPTNAEMEARTLLAASYATASALATVAGYLDTEIAAILAAVDTEVGTIVTAVGTTLPAQIAALNNLSAAQVNAEVLDVLNVDTFAESSAVPAATATLIAKIGFLATLARNKQTRTSTTALLLADNGSTTVATSTLSDDGTTFTRTEWV